MKYQLLFLTSLFLNELPTWLPLSRSPCNNKNTSQCLSGPPVCRALFQAPYVCELINPHSGPTGRCCNNSSGVTGLRDGRQSRYPGSLAPETTPQITTLNCLSPAQPTATQFSPTRCILSLHFTAASIWPSLLPLTRANAAWWGP